MVKGVTRRVVVVRPEPGDFFEEAIFLVKSGGDERSSADLLREACAIASRRSGRGPSRRLRKLLLLLLGALIGGAVTGGVWLLTTLLR